MNARDRMLIAQRPGVLRWLLAAVLLLALGLAPLGLVVARALEADLVAVITFEPYRDRLATTAKQAAAATSLALLLGVPSAYVFSRFRFPLHGLLRALCTLPALIPSLVLALAFQRLWVEAGRAPAATEVIVAAHTAFGAAIVMRLVGAAWANLDRTLDEAATTLGAGRLRRFTSLAAPHLGPAVVAAALLVFAATFTSFGVVYVLAAGNSDIETFEVLVYRLASQRAQLPVVAALGLVQLLATALLLLAAGLLRARAVLLAARDARYRRVPMPIRAASSAQMLLTVVVVSAHLALALLPLAALVRGAFVVGVEGETLRWGLSAANFQRLVDGETREPYLPALGALRVTALIAIASTALALSAAIVSCQAVTRLRGTRAYIARGALALPALVVPGVTLGFAYFLAAGRIEVWRGTPWPLVAAHAVIVYPFMLAVLLGSTRRIEAVRLTEAARVLGASALGAWWRVERPLMRRTLIMASLIGVLISSGESAATSLLQRAQFATVPVAILEALRPQLVGGAEGLGRALALATILLAVTALLALAVERIRVRGGVEY